MAKFSNDLKVYEGPDMATNDREDLSYRQRVAGNNTAQGTARPDMALGSQYAQQGAEDFKRGIKGAGDSNRVDKAMVRNGAQEQTVGMQDDIPQQVDGVTMGKRPQEHDITEAQSQGQMYEKARTRQQ